jgi:hypothetical protein
MNAKNEIEEILRTAPKPSAPDDLFNKLQADISSQTVEEKQTLLHKWFFPAGHVSFRRIAAMVLVTLAVLMPLAYGATKLVKVFHITMEVTTQYDDGSIGTTLEEFYTSGFDNEEEGNRILQEIEELRRAGEYEKIFEEERVIDEEMYHLYHYIYTLSDGQVVSIGQLEKVEVGSISD